MLVLAPLLDHGRAHLAHAVDLLRDALERGLWPELPDAHQDVGRTDGLAGAGCNTLAVEINIPLARALEALDVPVICEDFLTWSIHAGALFDRIVANPPFADGQDIAHIQRMIEMLKPGGKLVALCANGPRQQAQLRPLVDTWEDLPEGSFATSGTGVRVALVTYRAVA